MKILVTGSHGFIGTHLCDLLYDLDHEVVDYDLKSGFDITWCTLPDDVEWAFHLAAQTNAQTEDFEADAKTNILGTIRLAKKYKQRLVYSSSTAVHHPTTPYGISKMAAEHYALLAGASVVRFCNIFGPGGHGVIDAFQKADVLEIRGDGSQVRTYCHVTDAVTELWLQKGKPGLHLLKGFDCTVKNIADIFGKPVRHVPRSVNDVQDGRQHPNGPAVF